MVRSEAAAGRKPAGPPSFRDFVMRLRDRVLAPKTHAMPESELHWYAMRVFNNRILRVKECLEKAGAGTYMAMRNVD